MQAARARTPRAPPRSEAHEVVTEAPMPSSKKKNPSSRGTETDGWFIAWPLTTLIKPFKAAVPNRTAKPFAHRSTVNTAAVVAMTSKGQPIARGRAVCPRPVAFPPDIRTASARNMTKPWPWYVSSASRPAIIAARERGYQKPAIEVASNSSPMFRSADRAPGFCVLRQGQRLRLFPRAPFSASDILPALRFGQISLDDSDQCWQARRASLSSLRPLIGFATEP